jgi:hypothetical protein
MPPIEAMYEELQEARAAWNDLYGLLRQGQYDTSVLRQAIGDVSVDNLHQRALLVFELTESLRPETDQDKSAILMSSRSSEMRNAFTSIKNQAQGVVKQFKASWRENTVIKDANNNLSMQLFDGETNTANVDISGHLIQISKSVNELLAIVVILPSLCQSNAVGDLVERAQAFASIVHDVGKMQIEAQKHAKNVEQSVITSALKEKAIQDHLSQIETMASKVQATQQAAEKESASVNSLVAQIKSIGASADSLEQQVSSYKSKFEAFQTQLDARLKLFLDFEANVKSASEQNQLREAEISRLMEKADTMIRGATTAGLSKSLEDARDAYGKQMRNSRFGFLASIVVLLVSAIPLAAHLLPGLFGKFAPEISEGVQNSPLGVLGKIILLLPGTWLAVFFTKSFSEFFHLEREYAHKAALAKSVEGFKREAPKYQEEITASVFGEILNNPSSRKSPEPAQHPIYEVITKNLGNMFGSKKNGK